MQPNSHYPQTNINMTNVHQNPKFTNSLMLYCILKFYLMILINADIKL